MVATIVVCWFLVTFILPPPNTAPQPGTKECIKSMACIAQEQALEKEKLTKQISVDTLE